MDIMLERILSLIPKKENGDFQHGSQKAFANSIGLKSGNLIADWIKRVSEKDMTTVTTKDTKTAATKLMKSITMIIMTAIM